MLRRIPVQVWVLALVLACWALAAATHLRDVESWPVYPYLTAALLGIGLFASTSGIEVSQARAHRRIIALAITIGVLAKALIIGAVLYAATGDPLMWVLGVAVAQIDPLSVACLMTNRRMSERARTILAAWASFDDPMTVILVVYAAAVATTSFGLGHPSARSPLGGLAVYSLDLGANLALAALTYLCWRALRPCPRGRAVALGLLGAVAVWQFLMLAIALAGLFVRAPGRARTMRRLTTGALLVSGALLGVLLVQGVDLGRGVLLGSMAFVAQILAATALTRGMPQTDRVHLALAQQNGITAIILALRLETQFTGATAVTAPAIVVTNLVHATANRLWDRRTRPGPQNGPRG